MKQFDEFSFKPEKSVASSETNQIVTFSRIPEPSIQPSNWRSMNYRFEKVPMDHQYISKNSNGLKYELPMQSQYINKKIAKMDEEISNNIKRRIQLQNKLYKQKVQKQQQLNSQYFRQNHVKSHDEVAQLYRSLEQKKEEIDNNIQNKQHSNQKQQILPSPLAIPNAYHPNFTIPKPRTKQIKKSKPNQLRIQKLLTSVTFPELPSSNLEKLQQEIQAISINTDHSDISYLQMVINFHLSRYLKVRKYFKQIQGFKVYEKKAVWVAAQAQFELQSYELCLKITEQCLNLLKKRQLDDRCLPRILYLQARSYESIGNFINSVVCYNQLIKLRPKVPQFYLERGIIYDKIGYPRQAKEDISKYSKLQPQAFVHLKQKIMGCQSQIKRKQLLKVCAKLS